VADQSYHNKVIHTQRCIHSRTKIKLHTVLSKLCGPIQQHWSTLLYVSDVPTYGGMARLSCTGTLVHQSQY